MTVLFGLIGLIKHGKNVDIKEGLLACTDAQPAVVAQTGAPTGVSERIRPPALDRNFMGLLLSNFASLRLAGGKDRYLDRRKPCRNLGRLERTTFLNVGMMHRMVTTGTATTIAGSVSRGKRYSIIGMSGVNGLP